VTAAAPADAAAVGTDDGAQSEHAAGRRPDKETHVSSSVDRMVAQGAPRLRRSWLDLLATGTVAGLEVSIGVLALLVVLERTGDPLLAGLAFSFGFIALLLGHSELFTEGFLVPITVVAAKAARVRDLIGFWVGSLVGNLVGGFVMMWLVVHAFPRLHGTVIASATTFVDHGTTLEAFCLAVLAGATITMMTRMQSGTESVPAKLVVAVAGAFVLAGTQVAHAVLDTMLMFGALHTGAAPFGYADWLGWLGWAVLGNAVGGIGLVTVLRLVRSREQLAEHRAARS
jgi:formate/nitrite transporter FocA (FNT family)